MARTSYERFKKIIRICRFIGTALGVDFLDDNYKMNSITWFIIAVVNGYFSCTIYTIYIGFVVNGDWKIILQSLSLAGSAIQGYIKLIFGIKNQKILYDLHEILDNIYKDNEIDEDYVPVLRYRTDLTTKILKIVMGIYCCSATIICMYPLIYNLWYSERLLIMQFYLPGVDATTYSGYVMHNSVHFTLISIGAFGNFAADMLIFIFIIHVPLLTDVLQIKCKKLNRVITSKAESKDTMPMLKEIVNWHQKCNNFASDVEDAYYVVIFVQIFTSVMGICFTIFSIITRSWPAAFAYLALSSSMLYAYCGLGHLVELANDDIINVIYGDILWYELSVAEQKLVLLMLRKAQAPTTLTVGQIMPLSMSTALQLTKAIYSYIMMLANFLDGDEV